MGEQVYSVEQINRYLHDVVEAEELLYDIRIRGEVSGFGISGKHAYFTLKDDFAQISCVFFGYNAPFRVQDGISVIATGTPDYYVKGGRLSFRVVALAEAGEGDAAKRLAELTEKLRAEGLFARKRPLPSVIRRIGVVTSPTGAVIHDMINVATRRDPNIDIVLCPVKVQGIGAAMDVADGIRKLDALDLTDVVVVARGGGSAEDLSVFNDELVARAVASCDHVIVSAVGHETDFTFCDECADLRAPTPSAAAELLTSDYREKKLACGRLIAAIGDALDEKAEEYGARLSRALGSLRAYGADRVLRAENGVRGKLFALRAAMQTRAEAEAHRLSRSLHTLELVNPIRVLADGYAYVSRDGARVRGVGELAPGDRLDLRMADGKATVVVTEKRG